MKEKSNGRIEKSRGQGIFRWNGSRGKIKKRKKKKKEKKEKRREHAP